MSDANLELDERMAALEAEWRQVYEACVAARADLDRLRGRGEDSGGLVQVARSRLERLEISKARVMEKIERLEQSVSAGGRVSGRT